MVHRKKELRIGECGFHNCYQLAGLVVLVIVDYSEYSTCKVQ